MDKRLLELLPFPMVQPRRPHSLPNICHPPALSAAEGNVVRYLLFSAPHSPLVYPEFRGATHHSSLTTIPFRIKFFADPHPLTAIESHSYKKGGGRWDLQHLPHFSPAEKCSTHSNASNSNLFMRLLHGSLDTPGEGVCLFSAHSASLRYPFPLLATTPRSILGGPNEP
jgi:hypothetical protein